MADDRQARPALAAALSLPAAAAIALGFLLPVVWLARMSFNPVDASGALGQGWTTHQYVELVTDSFYAELTLASIKMAVSATLGALLVGYPIALFLHRLESRWKTLLVLLAISPLLVSGVVRAYGWMVILGDAGWINSMLRGIGLIDWPVRLVNNHIGVTIGLTESLLPYMTLSLLAGLGRLDRGLEEAARTLGASPFRTFLRVTLPLSLPAVVLGSTICLMLAISAFITPRLLGGGRVLLLATEIYEQALVTLNWPLAAAIAVAMLAMFSLVLFASGRLQRRVAE
jgi:putative spermidine/putrescine transport system permease protein